MIDIMIYIFSFVIIMSFIVFIHEFGHYFVARLCGVKIEEFAIGFGKEIWGRTNRWGERIKICALPFGGYVKMYGDASEASNVDSKIFDLSESEKSKTFFFKPIWQRFLIVFAGPLANYILSFFLFVSIFTFYGQPITSALVSKISDHSVAKKAGFEVGDNIISINGKRIRDFSDVQEIVSISPEIELIFLIERQGEQKSFLVIPERLQTVDFLGNNVDIGRIGIVSETVEYKNLTVVDAVNKSIYELYDTSVLTLMALKQIIVGERSFSDLSGPIRIAKYSGQVTKKAFTLVPGEFQLQLIFWFMAVISLNLGLVNLLPIPVLDGGHLFFYTIEAIRRRPISFKVQEAIFRVGLSFLLIVFSFVVISDLQIVFG